MEALHPGPSNSKESKTHLQKAAISMTALKRNTVMQIYLVLAEQQKTSFFCLPLIKTPKQTHSNCPIPAVCLHVGHEVTAMIYLALFCVFLLCCFRLVFFKHSFHSLEGSGK